VDKSLQRIYANLFGEKISKNQRLSNWEAEVLTEAQQLYAAIDAWACVRIYNLLQGLERTGDYELIMNQPIPDKTNDEV
jgi:ribonuclease D